MNCPKCTGALPTAGMSRRGVLSRFGMGLGGIALANLVNPASVLRASSRRTRPGPRRPRRPAPSCRRRRSASSISSWPAGRRRWRRSTTSRMLNQRNGEQLPDSVRQGPAAHRHVGQSVVSAARGIAVRVQPAWGQRHMGQRSAAPHREDRGRAVHRPLDVHRGDQPRSRDHVLPDRLADRRPAEHGLVDSLRAGQRQRRSAGVRRAHHPRQGRSAALLAPVGQRLPAVAVSGRAVPERQGRGVVSGESRWRDARGPAAAARPAARTARARRRDARRHGGRRAHRAVRDVIPACRRACPA